jgi:hypothetical protein
LRDNLGTPGKDCLRREFVLPHKEGMPMLPTGGIAARRVNLRSEAA